MGLKRVILLCYALFFFSSILISCSEHEPQKTKFMSKRRLLQLEQEDEEELPKKKINVNLLSPKKNLTKLVKPKTNSTQKILSTTNLIKPQMIKKLNSTSKSSNSTQKTSTLISLKTQFKKLNSTSKSSNSTKPNSNLIKISSDLPKTNTPKNKTSTPITLKQSNITKTQSKDKKTISQKTQNPTLLPIWFEQQDEDDDLVAEIRDLPSKFQQTLLPDLEKISKKSKDYMNRANKEITKGFKPIVGAKYAPTIAIVISCAFIFLPLLLVSLIFNHFKSYFSLQKILIFIQIYLSIYFSILCFTSVITGLEPLRFFYSTSQYTYIWLQVLQTLGYVLYLLTLLMYLVLTFSTDCGLGSKLLGLGQTFVGFAVGLHYYVSVFHRVVLHQPPKTNWKIHGIYATCFLVICLLARAERRKKSYLEEGGEQGKKN